MPTSFVTYWLLTLLPALLPVLRAWASQAVQPQITRLAIPLATRRPSVTMAQAAR